MIVIVDYKMGNLGSIANMLKKIGVDCRITSDHSEILSARKLILPGVGHFDMAMKNLNDFGLTAVLNQKVLKEKIPVLGICLGMQLLAHSSEEAKKPGLGWIDGEVKRFNFEGLSGNKLKIPHMGWNTLHNLKNHMLFKNMYSEPRFYFVHSYYFTCRYTKNILSTSFYGYDFVSAVVNKNIMGVQFHPEKSHKFGMLLLRNFAENFG